MSRPRNERPGFVSINIQRVCILAEQLGDKWGEWSKKAVEDMLHGCVAGDVDPIVRECYEHAMGRMKLSQELQHRKYESRKNKANETASTTEIAPIGAVKRNDQLIWGRFENVYLSQDEYNALAAEFGNINALNKTIDSLSASIADGSCETRNHYATLSRWIAWRRQKEEQDAANGNRHESFSEHNRRIHEQSRREVQYLKEQGLLK